MAEECSRREEVQAQNLPGTPGRLQIPALAEICASPATFLEQFDIGALNLVCAGGLPFAETLEMDRYVDWLDEAARKADFDTRRHWYRFIDSPGTYNNSPGYFCCYHLLQALQEDFGVRYNPARIRDPTLKDPQAFQADFKDSRDLFIHGIIDGAGGTCSSMPVLYVAVGRRLGYPLKLVETRGHLFFRWDDPLGKRLGVPEVFNVEGSGHGIHSYPDEHYRTWPEIWSEADHAGGWYLTSLSPTGELAAFLSTRGECLTDNGRIDEAVQVYRWVCDLAPADLRYQSQLMRLQAMAFNRRLEFDALQELNRANRERFLRDPFGAHRDTQVLRHGKYCYCEQCQRANDNVPVPPHGPSCQCFHCCQARKAAANMRGAPGHPPSCPCYQCRQKRGRRAEPGMPSQNQPW